MLRMLMPVLLTLVSRLASAAIGGPRPVTWTTVTAEPGRNEKKQPTFQGGMPLGNGDLAVLAWPNVSAGALQMYVAKADAHASDTMLFKLAMVTLAVAPNPFQGSYFNQTLDMHTATVRRTASYREWIDAERPAIGHTKELLVHLHELPAHVPPHTEDDDFHWPIC